MPTEYKIKKTPKLTKLRNKLSKIFPSVYAGDEGLAPADSIKIKKWWIEFVTRATNLALSKYYEYSITNIGGENNKIPSSGPVIYTSYHGNILDPFWIGPQIFLENHLSVISVAREDMFSPDYYIHLLRKSGVEKTKLESIVYAVPFNWFFRSSGAVPIMRSTETSLDELIYDEEIRRNISKVVLGREDLSQELTLRDVLKLNEEAIKVKGGKFATKISDLVAKVRRWHSDNINQQIQPMSDSLEKNEAVLIFPQGGRDRGLGLDKLSMGGLDRLTTIEGVNPQILPLYVGLDDIGLSYIGEKKKVIMNAGDAFYRKGTKKNLEKDTRAAIQRTYVAGFDDVLGRMMINWADSYNQRKESYSVTQIIDSFYTALEYLQTSEVGITLERSLRNISKNEEDVESTIQRVLDEVGDPEDWGNNEFKLFRQIIGKSRISDVEKRIIGALAYMEKKGYLEKNNDNQYIVGKRLRKKPERGRSYEAENKIRQRSNRFTTHVKGAYKINLSQIKIS